MSCIQMSDKELFENGVCITRKFNEQLQIELQGIRSTKNNAESETETFDIPCIYKKILSYKNGFARAIDMSGSLIYISHDGEKLFDREFPFIAELCSDFDETGVAKIGCLWDEAFIITGYMNEYGEMFFPGHVLIN